MDGGEDILADDALGEHDGILEVVSLPGHEGHLQVASQGEFAVLGGVTFGEDLSLDHLVALADDRGEVDGGTLVGLPVLRKLVDRDVRVEAHEALGIGAVVFDVNLTCVHKDDFALALRHDLRAGVAGHGAFQAGTYNRSLRLDDRNGLAHHVRSHEGTVRVVVLEERDEGCGDGCHLVRGDVHEVDVVLGADREVRLEAALDTVVQDVALVVDIDVGLCNELVLFLFCAEVHQTFVTHVHLAAVDLAVRGLDETQVVDLGIDAERGDQADVRTFRRLDRAEAAVVRVVNVSHFETGPFAGKTARTQCGETALVRHLGQRVDLVHELGELAGGEEGIDHGREGLRVDQFRRRKHLIVTDIHSFADGACHTCQTYAELVGELLAHRADTTVAQVVDIIDGGLGVDQLHKVLDNLDDVFTGQDADVGRSRKVQLLVETVASHGAQVVAFVGEEQLVDHVAGGCLIRRFAVADLAVGIVDSLLFGVALVFGEGVVDDGEVVGSRIVLVEEDGLRTRVEDILDVFFLEDGLTLDDRDVALDVDHLAGLFVDEVFVPGLEDAGRHLATDAFLQVFLGNFHLAGQAEDVEDVLVALETDGAQEGGYR